MWLFLYSWWTFRKYFFFFALGRGGGQGGGGGGVGFFFEIQRGGGSSKRGEGAGGWEGACGEFKGGGPNTFFRGRNSHQVYGWSHPGVRPQIWVCLITLICVISPHSNGAVQIRVGLELAETSEFSYGKCSETLPKLWGLRSGTFKGRVTEGADSTPP